MSESRRQMYREIIDDLRKHGLNPLPMIVEFSQDMTTSETDKLFDGLEVSKIKRLWWRVEGFFRDWFKSLTNPSWWNRMYKWARTGVNEADAWNLDYAFFRWLSPRIKVFQKELDHPFMGIPSELAAQMPEEEAAAEWKRIVGEIVWTADFALYEYSDSADEWAWIRYENGMMLFSKWLKDLWW